ncbi:TonB-dependent receptor [Sphingomonas zeicaulis]|uniref:TonB-dependent receptor n=1 Tax=Sphingomonas zeicaulis TaxID=1632740 RepID=UPI003D22A319
MTRSLRMLSHVVSGMALAAALAPAAHAQADSPAAEAEQQEIIVTGIRASLESAQGIKRNATQIVDSIVAEDIGKLPDINVAEALQRVSGIQIGRDRGEGSSIAIRGLTQVLTTLNGREIFTAGNDRTFNLQDLPAELVSGIDVYKTPSANLIEGGIGGVIDVRTRRPLDSKELVLSASARARYSDLVDEVKPMASLLVSKSWDVGDGEFGILVAGAYQERAFATDIVNVGAPAARTDIIAGQTVATPNGSYQPAIAGNRRRIGIDAMMQYKPNPDLEFYAQFGYQDFKSIQEQFGLNIPTNGRTPIPGTAVLFEGTNDIRSISYQNVNFNTFGVARDTYDENFQYSGGVRYDRDGIHLHVDANYSKSTNTLFYSELALAGIAPRVDQDISTDVPSMLIRGVDLNNINSYAVGSLTRNENRYKGELKAVKGDLTFDIESPFLTGMSFGLRYADRSTDFEPTRFFVTRGGSAAPFADLFIGNPLDSMFSGSDAIDQSFLVADYRRLRGDFDGVRQTLGITTAPAVTPLGIYSINEDTMAGYAMGTFAIEGPLRIDGNAGVRVIKTNLNVVGNRALFTQPVPGGPFQQTGFAPVNVDTSYVSVLPSANMRIRFTDELQLRLAASKVLTRPSFGQLAPTLTLVPAQQTGGSGNPDLDPLRADQLDASLEYYFSRTGSVYVAGFYRKVKGFIRNVTGDIEVIDGIEYRISRPTNSEDGKIKGFEVGGQMFMDFLPGALSGFGVQANYTFVDSNTPTSVAGLFTPLPNLSKHSFNTSLIYEKGPISARVAYNWRDRFYSGLYSSGAIALNSPVYRKAYGWLDASINVDVTDQITLTLEGQNLTRAKTDTYYTVPTRRGNLEQDDIQVLAGVRFTL